MFASAHNFRRHPRHVVMLRLLPLRRLGVSGMAVVMSVALFTAPEARPASSPTPKLFTVTPITLATGVASATGAGHGRRPQR